MRLPSPYLLVVSLGCLLLQLGCRPGGVPPSLSGFHGCDDLWFEPGTGASGTYVCALAESSGSVQRLGVQATAPAGVALVPLGAAAGTKGGLVSQQLRADGRLSFEVTYAGLPQRLTLTERSPLGLATDGPAVHIRLVKQQLLPSEVTAATARRQHTIPAAITELRAAAATPSHQPAARARLLHALADLELEAAQNSEAQRHFEQALELAVPTGLTLVAANSARLLAFQHYTLRRDIPTALKILEKYDPAIRMIDIEAALALYNRGVYAQERGRLSEAVRLLATAKEAVKDLDDDTSRRGIARMYAVALAQQGLTKKAEEQVQELLAELRRPGGSWDVCERMRTLTNLGWTRILGQEAHSPGTLDPIPLFTQALFYRTQDGCPNDGRTIAMNWARAEVLLAERLAEATPPTGQPVPGAALDPALSVHLQAAAARLHEGTQDEANPSLSRQLDAAELRGRIAYLRADFAEAEAQFAQLAGLAQKSEEPDYQERAIINQALVSAALARTADAASAERYTRAARTAFAHAEAQLDERLAWVPHTAARRAFLPRFTTGTAAYLEFLLAHKENAAAFAVARRAQVRGLVATLSFDTLDLLPEEQRARLRQERDALLRQSELTGNKAATGQQFETLLTHLRDAGLDQLPLRPLQPGEVTHLCHPLPHGELACFVADPQTLQVERVSAQAVQQAQDSDDREQQARLLLAPFAALINRAQVLRVLPNQWLRRVNFPALPWSGESGYLSSQERLVVYALDLDLGRRAAVPPAVRGQALMLTNLNLKHAQLSAPGLFARLQQLGWQVTPYSNQPFDHGTNLRRRLLCRLGLQVCPPPLALPVKTLAGSASMMKQALPQAELAQLDTHAQYGKDSGWQSELQMPDQSSLSIYDLLTLERAPRWTVLLVCEGGTAGQGDDADDISLAQALLLRGGEAVVASIRPLEDELSSHWSQALYGPKDGPTAYLGAQNPSLTAAFRAAQATLRQSRAPQRDWSALRLFVP